MMVIQGDHRGSCPAYGRVVARGARFNGNAFCPCTLDDDNVRDAMDFIAGQLEMADSGFVLQMRVIVGVAMLDPEVG